jgi:hypothetical protein
LLELLLHTLRDRSRRSCPSSITAGEKYDVLRSYVKVGQGTRKWTKVQLFSGVGNFMKRAENVLKTCFEDHTEVVRESGPKYNFFLGWEISWNVQKTCVKRVLKTWFFCQNVCGPHFGAPLLGHLGPQGAEKKSGHSPQVSSSIPSITTIVPAPPASQRFFKVGTYVKIDQLWGALGGPLE